MQDVQWGRQCTVVFKNFQNDTVTTINDYRIVNENRFRVEFEYTKSIDESSNMSNGHIKIYGLTIDRFEIIGEPMECEIELHAGYEKSLSNPLRLLFKAILVDKSYEYSNGMSVSTFRVLGDFIKANKVTLNTPIADYKNPSTKLQLTKNEGVRLIDVIEDIAKRMGVEVYGIVRTWENLIGGASGVEETSDFDDYVTHLNYPIGVTMYGTPKQSLDSVCDDFGLTWSLSNDNKELRLAFTDAALSYHMRRSKEMSDPISNRPVLSVTDGNPPAVKNYFIRDKHSYLLNSSTGLIGTPSVKTRQVTKAYDQILAGNETLVSQDPIRVKKNKKGEPVVDKETKQIKYVVPKTKKVWRRSVTAQCFINASIEPQTYVTLQTDSENRYIDGDYRVRTIQIQGDTDGSSWFMNLELEGEF